MSVGSTRVTSSGVPGWVRIAVPWGVGAGILWALFTRVDPAQTARALAAGSLAGYVPLAVLFVGVWLALDSWILAWLFARVGARVGWRGMARLRGESYAPMVISFHLGSAALVASLRRTTGVGLATLTGAMLVHYLADVAAVAGVALIASLAVDSELLAVLRPILAAIALAAVVVLAAGHLGRGFASRRSTARILAALSAPELGALIALRACFHLTFAVFVWLTAPRFALDIPLVDALARVPIVLSIAALPISPGGVGTAQAAMLWLFRPFGTPEQTLAYAVVYGLTLILFRLPIGVGLWLASRRRPPDDAGYEVRPDPAGPPD